MGPFWTFSMRMPSIVELLNFMHPNGINPAESWRHIALSRWRKRRGNFTPNFGEISQSTRPRYYYFRFPKTNGRHVRISLSVSIITFASPSAYVILHLPTKFRPNGTIRDTIMEESEKRDGKGEDPQGLVHSPYARNPEKNTPIYRMDVFTTSLSKPAEFKVIQGQWSWCQLEARWWFAVWPPLCLTLHLSRYSRYMMRKFGDLDLGRLKVIEVQSSWSESIPHRRFSLRLPLKK